MSRYEAVVIGVSAGGMKALSILLAALPADYPLAVIIVQHMVEGSDSYLSEYLNDLVPLRVIEGYDKLAIDGSTVYVAPPGYHLLIEENRSFSLSVDPRVNYSRPSVDVLFESAAFVYERGCIGVVLTGANNDGSVGIRKIKAYGGTTIVQDPSTAEFEAMPKAAVETMAADYIVPLEEIGPLLLSLAGEPMQV